MANDPAGRPAVRRRRRRNPSRIVVLHDDKDFELIAEITGQPTQRLTA